MGNVHCVTHPIPLSELEEDEVLKTLEKEYYERDFDSSSHELKVRYNFKYPWNIVYDASIWWLWYNFDVDYITYTLLFPTVEWFLINIL